MPILQPNGFYSVVASANANFIDTNVAGENTNIIFKMQGQLGPSYVPGRAINGITAFEKGIGYYIITGEEPLDLTGIIVDQFEQLAVNFSFAADLYTNTVMGAPTESITYWAKEQGIYNNLKLANGNAAPAITISDDDIASPFPFLTYSAETDTWSKNVKNVDVSAAVDAAMVPVNLEIDKLNTAFEDSTTEDNVSQSYTTPAPVWNNTTSTFTGFGSNIGAKQNFNTVIFNIRGKSTISTPITKCKVWICDTNKSGAILATGEVTGLSIAASVIQEIKILLNTTIANPGAANLFMLYVCDNHCDHYGNITNSVFPLPTYALACFKSSATPADAYAATEPGNFSNNSDTVNQQTLRITMSLASVSVSLTDEQIKDISERLPPVEGDAALNKSSTNLIQNAPVAVEIEKLKNPFEEGNISTDPIPNYTGSASWILPTSTFTGFSSNLGIAKDFNRLRLRIRAKSTASAPITKCKLWICVNNKSGTILTSAEVTGLSLAPLQEATIVFNLPITVENAENNNLFAAWVADGLIDYWGINTNSYFPNPTFPQMAYTVSTSYNTVVPSEFQNTAGSVNYSSHIETFFNGDIYILSDIQLTNISERLAGPSPVEVVLPDTIYAVVGDTLQIFYRGVIKAVNPYNYNILVTCAKGNQYHRYFEFTPVTGDIGTHAFNIKVKDSSGRVLAEKTTNLVVKSAGVNPSSPITALCIGDSLTADGTWVVEAARRLNGSGGSPAGKGFSNALFKGRKTSGSVGWEGTGGWQWSNYTTAGTTAQRFTVSGVVTAPGIGSKYTHNGTLYEIQEVNITSGSGNIRAVVYAPGPAPTVSGTLTKSDGAGDTTISFSSYTTESGNPFWNTGTGQLDIVSYVNTYCNGDLDVVYFLLTWNGQTPWRTNFDTFKSQARTLFDHIHTNYPACKIKLMGVQVPSLNGGMGANYGATGTGYADGYGMVVTALNMNKAYQDLANEASYASYVEFVNVSSQVDSENNGQQADAPVNTRNTAVEKRGTNGVHPASPGYMQISDIVVRNFIANFCQ